MGSYIESINYTVDCSASDQSRNQLPVTYVREQIWNSVGGGTVRAVWCTGWVTGRVW